MMSRWVLVLEGCLVLGSWSLMLPPLQCSRHFERQAMTQSSYKFLHGRGALCEAETSAPTRRPRVVPAPGVGIADIDPEVVRLVPEAVARDNVVMPLDFDGETITFAAVDADNIALADKLRFSLAK